MGTSLYDEFLREQNRNKGLLRQPSVPRTPRRSLQEEFEEEQRIAAVQPRDDSFTGTVRRGLGGLAVLGKGLAKDAAYIGAAGNPFLASSAQDHPLATTKMIGKGLLESGADLARLNMPLVGVPQILRETGGDKKEAALRIANALSLLAGPAARGLGMGAKAAWAAEAASDAALGAAANPNDRGAGAVTGLVAGQALELAGAAKRGVDRMRGGRGVPTSAAPEVPVELGPREAVLPKLPEGGKAEVAARLEGAFDAASKAAPKVTDLEREVIMNRAQDLVPKTSVRRRATGEAERQAAAARAQEALDAQGLETQSFGNDTGLEAILPDAPNRLRDLMRGGRSRPAVNNGAEQFAKRGFGGDTQSLIDEVRAAAREAGSPVDEAFPRPMGPLAPVADEVFPEGASFAGNVPRRGTYDSAMGNVVDDDVLRLARESADREARATAAAIPVPPRANPAPAAGEAFPDGYFMPDPERAPVEAVPHDARGAKLFVNSKQAAGGASAPKTDGSAPVAPDGGIDFAAVESNLDRFLDAFSRSGATVARRQDVADVFGRYQKALQATGDHTIALEALNNGRERTLVKKALGAVKMPKVDPNAPLPDTPGVQKLSSSKTVDYRATSDDDLFAQMRQYQNRIDEGERMMNEGVWTRSDDHNMVGVSGRTRVYGRGLAMKNQSNQMMAAIESELRARLTAKGLTPDEVESAINSARFSDTAPTLRGARALADDEALPDEALAGREAEFDGPLDEPVLDAQAGNAGPGLGTMDEGGSAMPPIRPPEPPNAPAGIVGAAGPEAAPAAPIAAPQAAAFTKMEPAQTDNFVRQEGGKPVVEEGHLNWRTLGDRTGPLGVATATRLQEAAAASAGRLKAERGYMGFDAQREEALKSQVVRELFDNPLAIDRTKLNGLSGAQIVAVKDIAQENARMADMIARDIEQGLGADDLAKATEMLERLNASTNEALATIVGESSRVARDLGYLRNLSRLSTDAATWKVMAKKRLGDQPLTMEMEMKIERLAKEAAEACG